MGLAAVSTGELVTAGDSSEFLFFQIIFVAALPQAEQSCAPTLSPSKYWEVAITGRKSSHT